MLFALPSLSRSITFPFNRSREWFTTYIRERRVGNGCADLDRGQVVVEGRERRVGIKSEPLPPWITRGRTNKLPGLNLPRGITNQAAIRFDWTIKSSR